MGRACAAQRMRTRAGRRAGGIDVIDQQHVAAGELRGPRDKKSAANIRAALMRAEARLTFRCALACQRARDEFEAHLRTAASQDGDGAARQALRLVESPLALLC